MHAEKTYEKLKILFDYYLGVLDEEIEYSIGYNIFHNIPVSYF